MSEHVRILPDDEHNRTLVERVHPPDWKNPEPAPKYNLVVVGAGTAGLVSAIGASTLGAQVAIVEKSLMGGDCLNFGCVPSKAVIRSSRVMGEVLKAAAYGINVTGKPDVDFTKVMERMRRLRAQISQNDSVQRYVSLGCHVFLGEGRFVDRHSLEVDGKILRFRKAVIATGARPAHPDIEGLSEAGYLTNETVFSLTERPNKLAVIGGGPVGVELAQAFCRLGSAVTIIQRNRQFLPREDRDAAGLLSEVLEREGVNCRLETQVTKVTKTAGKKILHLTGPDGEETIEVDEILVGAGRIPNVEDLNLEAAGVVYDPRDGVKVNEFLQTTNKDIYAAGDVCYPYKFTHTAEATARIVIQNALFLKSAKHTSLVIPWCTYTDPEIAHVGMYEKEALDKGIPVETFTNSFKVVDRAILDGEEEGFIKIHVKKGKSKILGATIVAKNAGDLLSEITLAMVTGKGVKPMCRGMIHPYPTQSDVVKRTASQYYEKKMSPFLSKILKRWFSWKRK
jgi:pyruvate/2-oxoglutarate dehydrogenase complex dihydrolipoamide dehydrogenase (E3) component